MEELGFPYGIYPSTSSLKTLEAMRKSCEMSRTWNLFPNARRVPWGYICMYEAMFQHCRLWLSLPYQFVDYYENREVAFTQMTTVGICNMVGLMVFGAETDLEVSVEMFEQVSLVNQVSKVGHFYTSMRPSCKLNLDFKNKVNHWDERYFFVKIDFASFSDFMRHYWMEWNPTMGRCFAVVWFYVFLSYFSNTLFLWFQFVILLLSRSRNCLSKKTLRNSGRSGIVSGLNSPSREFNEPVLRSVWALSYILLSAILSSSNSNCNCLLFLADHWDKQYWHTEMGLLDSIPDYTPQPLHWFDHQPRSESELLGKSPPRWQLMSPRLTSSLL